jgi:hypothetical protein
VPMSPRAGTVRSHFWLRIAAAGFFSNLSGD